MNIQDLTGGEAALLKSRVAELTAERDALKTANADLSQYAAMVKAERDRLKEALESAPRAGTWPAYLSGGEYQEWHNRTRSLLK